MHSPTSEGTAHMLSLEFASDCWVLQQSANKKVTPHTDMHLLYVIGLLSCIWRRLRLTKARIAGCKRQCVPHGQCVPQGCGSMCQSNMMMYNPNGCGCNNGSACNNGSMNGMMGGMLGGPPMAPYHRPNIREQSHNITQANAAWDKFFYMCRLPLELGQ